jgi:hypothetical protein
LGDSNPALGCLRDDSVIAAESIRVQMLGLASPDVELFGFGRR